MREESAGILGHDNIALGANHVEMVKYRGPEDPSFKKVRQEILKKCMAARDAPQRQPLPVPPGSPEDSNELRDLALRFPLDHWDKRAIWRTLLPRALQLLGAAKYVDAQICKLGSRVGRCLITDGRTGEAVNLLENLVNLSRNRMAETDDGRLKLRQVLTRALTLNGQAKIAVVNQEDVVKARGNLREDNLDLLLSKQVLARAYEGDGQAQRAVEMLESIVMIRQNMPRQSRPTETLLQTINAQHLLGRAYLAAGHVQNAIQQLNAVVSTRDNLLSRDHPERLASQTQLARAYEADGQFDMALPLLKNVAAIRNECLAKEHPDRLKSQHELARGLMGIGQVREAVEILEHVVALREQALGQQHPALVASRLDLDRARSMRR